jgi:hypothetical protein
MVNVLKCTFYTINSEEPLVYDGFGQGMLNSGVESTREDAIAVAQNWAIEFLEGRIPYKSNFRYDSTTF